MPEALQRPDRLQSPQHTNPAIIFSRSRNSIRMRPGGNRRERGIASDPPCKHVADGIHTNREPGLLTSRTKPGARFKILRRKKHAGDRGSRMPGNRCERVDFPGQPVAINGRQGDG